MFDPDDLDAAYAELDRRYTAGEGAPHAALLAKLRAVGTGDQDALASSLADGFRFVSHRRFFAGTAWSRDEFLAHLRTGMGDVDVRNRVRIDHVPRLSATAGVGVLALYGTVGGGDFEIPIVNVFTHDGSRLHTIETFDLDQLDAALVRYEELVGTADDARHARESGHPSAAGEWIPASAEMTNGLKPGLARQQAVGAEDREPEEVPLVGSTAAAIVPEFIPNRARLPRGRIEGFANAATRVGERFVSAWETRDWDGVAAVFAPACIVDDRRRLMRRQFTGGINLAQLRTLFEAPQSRWTHTTIATRGERLALRRLLFEGEVEQGGGALAIDYLTVVEVDVDGRVAHAVGFDLDDLDAAYAELDARYAAGEGAPYAALYAALLANLRSLLETGSTLDRDALASLLSDDFKLVSHRRFASTGTVLSREDFFAALRAGMGDVDVRSRVRVDHVLRLSATAGVSVLALYGTVGGGDFEIPIVNVFTHDGSRLHTIETFDLDQLDAALVRYEELNDTGFPRPRREGVARTPPCIENAATRFIDRFEDAWAAHDWDGIGAAFAPDFRLIDRRSYAHLDLDRDQHLASLQFRFEMRSSRHTSEVLATRGHRLALMRTRFELAGGDVGPSETESLGVLGSDERGDCVALVMFDPDDLDAAYAEIDRRYTAGEAAPHARPWEWLQGFERSVAARDWEQWASAFAPDYVVEDHRRLGWGTLHSRDEYMAYVRALVDLAPDVTTRLDHVLALDDRGTLVILRWVGSREGGPFEMPLVAVSALPRAGASNAATSTTSTSSTRPGRGSRRCGVQIRSTKFEIRNPNDQNAYEASRQSRVQSRVSLHRPFSTLDCRL
jgi:hypothetical protein